MRLPIHNTHLPNGVSSTQTEPLRKRTVLSHLLSENTLGAERLLRRLYNGLVIADKADSTRLPLSTC